MTDPDAEPERPEPSDIDPDPQTYYEKCHCPDCEVGTDDRRYWR